MKFTKKFRKVNPVKWVGSFLNDVTGVTDTSNTSYKQSEQMAAQQQANNISLWNMQNQYNTPAAQIARMADAGIDINPMTYAVGNGTMQSTAQNVSPASYHAPSYGSAGNPIAAVLSIMSGIQDYKYKQKMIDNYEHDHAAPYKDVVDLLKSFFKDAPSYFQGWKDPSKAPPKAKGRDRNGWYETDDRGNKYYGA